jgi:hypothetical protein
MAGQRSRNDCEAAPLGSGGRKDAPRHLRSARSAPIIQTNPDHRTGPPALPPIQSRPAACHAPPSLRPTVRARSPAPLTQNRPAG